MNALLALPIGLPIAGAAASILVGRWRAAQRVVGVGVLAVVSGLSVILLLRVDRNGTAVAAAGGWPAPLGITLVADRFSAIMLVTASLMLVSVLVYAIGQPGAERRHVGFQSVYLLLAAGVNASFLTGDLFNLFVAIEVMLTASYVLITLGGRLEQVRSGMTYVVISLIASALFLAAVALTYSATGTVNLADLATRIPELPSGVRAGLAVLLVVVFGIKAAVFPFFFWLPDSYPTAPSPVTAIFAGLLTKVGVYALIRTQTLLFPPDTRPVTVMLVLAGITMLVGVFGAIAQGDVKRVLSFQIVSHIGYMVMGLALFTVTGLAAAVLYIVHHIVAKTALFLTGGLIEHTGGSSRLTRLGGMVNVSPVLAVLFLVPALSLVGVPPLSGFVPKFALVDAAAAGSHYGIMAVALAVSLLTLVSMMKIWNSVFWAPAVEPAEPVDSGPAVRSSARMRRLGGPAWMVIPTAALVLLTVAIGIAAGPLLALSDRAATDLLEPSSYIRAVLGP